MAPIRVLHVLGGLNAGGMETMIMNYYRNIDRDKVQFDFLVFSQKSFFDDDIEKLGGKIYRITPRRQSLIANAREINLFFENHSEYKIIHIHQGILNLSVLKKASKYKIPVIVAHSHGVDMKQLKKFGLYNNIYAKPMISKLASDYFTCSELVAKHIFIDEIINDRKYVVVKNAIDTQKFAYDESIRTKIRCELNLTDKFVIGHVGAFLPVKNHDFIVDIFSEIHKKNPNAILLLIGTGKLEEKIRVKIRKLNLQNNIILLGQRNDIHDLMQAMDVFLLPSLFEGLPVVSIEAQASGLKCFISDNITKELKITDLVEFVSLQKEASYWASKIVNCNIKHDRVQIKVEIEKSGFDIKKQAKKLEEFYIKKINKYKEELK